METTRRRPGRPARSSTTEHRSELIAAALECFGARGFDGASLSQIARLAGTDVALTRYYFGSKEALWMEAVDHLAAHLQSELSQVFEQSQAGEAELLELVIRWFVDMSARHPYLSRIIVLDGANEDARGRHLAANVIGPFYKVVSRLILAAKRQGRIPDVAPRTIFFMITHGGSFPMAMPALTNAFPGGEIATKRALNAHADAIIALILRKEAG